MAKPIKQSETIEIKRSQININPFNPKRHTDKKVMEQKKNLQRVGFLGGITWNKRTGNLIDGHRRIKAMDLYYGYDGTEETNYSVKVEAVDFDDKQEKEQMTYMALGNTKADLQLIAEYLPDIDYTAAGIDEIDLAQIQAFIPSVESVPVESFDDLISTPEPKEEEKIHTGTEEQQVKEDKAPLTPEEKKAAVKEAKAAANERAVESFRNLTAYITISFENAEQKQIFCDLAGIGEDDKFVQGEKILEMIN